VGEDFAITYLLLGKEVDTSRLCKFQAEVEIVAVRVGLLFQTALSSPFPRSVESNHGYGSINVSIRDKVGCGSVPTLSIYT
jgi:hypothetical protein